MICVVACCSVMMFGLAFVYVYVYVVFDVAVDVVVDVGVDAYGFLLRVVLLMRVVAS